MLTATIRNTDDSVAGYLLAFRDITKEHAAKAEIERQVIERTEQVHEEQIKLKTSIDSLSLGFVMADHNNQVILSNNAIQQILGSPNDGWTLPKLAGRFEQGFDLEAVCREVTQTRQRRYIEKVNSAQKILRVFVAPVAYRADTTGVVILIEDVTEEEIMNRSKDEFFSIASHELRTPLTAIRGNTNMILNYYTDVLKDEQLKEMVYDIHESSTRLIDIVNDFLDVSRIEQGKMTYNAEEVALDEVIENVTYEMAAVLKERNLSLDFDHKTLGELPKVWADKNRLKQILYNLVGNAAKFTENGGVSINVLPEGPLIKVLVTDTGRGIPAESQKLLFHKFQQASESLLTRDTTRGTGLGLYISKLMTQAMGGSLALEHSQEGKGSTFSFTIPVATDELKKADSKAVRTDIETGMTEKVAVADVARKDQNDQVGIPPDNRKPIVDPKALKLLIVEDDPYVIRLYERLFSFEKLVVQTATDGKKGIKLAKSFQPNLILLDIMMSNMNGLEALDKLKSDTETKDIPVIILSNIDEPATVATAMDKGAAAYMLKSEFTPEQVLVEIQKTLKVPLLK